MTGEAIMQRNQTARTTCLYDAAQLDQVLREMARRAAGLLTGASRVAVVGIRRRGVPLANRVTEALVRDFGIKAPLRLDLAIQRYADDLTLLHPETRLVEDPAHAGLDLSGASVVVVDDVIYRGYSMLRAVQYLAQKNPSELRTVVLVDRGALKLPVRVDVAGVRLDVAASDIIECRVPPYESEWGIHLVQPRGA